MFEGYDGCDQGLIKIDWGKYNALIELFSDSLQLIDQTMATAPTQYTTKISEFYRYLCVSLYSNILIT